MFSWQTGEFCTPCSNDPHLSCLGRYCDAISSSISRASPYFTTTFMEQLKGLSNRLTAAPQLEKSTSWMGSKMPKPSLDSIGNYIGNSLSKFITGDADSPRQSESSTPPTQDRSYSGPFANYSAISSATSSGVPTPNGSTTDLTGQISSPPLRSGSAMALRTNIPHAGVNRSSSAMDFITPMNRKASPIPRVLSANAATTTFPMSSHPRTFDGSSLKNDLHEASSETDMSPDGHSPSENDRPSYPQVASWWETSESAEATTPTASAFVQLKDTNVPVSSGFISLMDDPSISATPTATSRNSFNRGSARAFEDEEDDLGLGNSSTHAKAQQQRTESEKKSPVDESRPQPVEKPRKSFYRYNVTSSYFFAVSSPSIHILFLKFLD